MSERGARLRTQIALHRHLAARYEARFRPVYGRLYHRFWNRLMLALLGGRPLGATLDLGCGTGILGPELRAAEPCIGLDLSREMLRLAQGYDGRINGEMNALPFAAQSFDTVFARGALHHSADLPGALREVHRVLKPGGMLIAAEPREDFWLAQVARRALYRLSGDFDPRDYRFQERELDALLGRARLRLLATQGYGYAAYTLAGFPDKFDPLCRVPGAEFLVRALIRLDSCIARVPGLERIGLGILFAAEAL